MADRLATDLLVGLGEGPENVAAAGIGQGHGDEIAGIDLLQNRLGVVAVARTADGRAAGRNLVGPRRRGPRSPPPQA